MRVIEVEGLEWSGILHGVSLSLDAGEALGLLGPNGSGKSTLLKALAGVVEEPEGANPSTRIRVASADGVLQSRAEFSPRELSSRIAYLGGELNSEFPIRVEQVLEISRRSDQNIAVAEALEFFGIPQLRARRLQALSSGERQMVALARALLQGARIWFLDEALVKLDLHHRRIVVDRLTELMGRGYAFILVSHDLSWIERFCARGLWLKAGRSWAVGPLAEMLREERVREAYSGEP